MTTRIDELLTQLRLISPMPADTLLTVEILQTYEAIINDLRVLNNPRAIMPIMESFGYGLAHGVYWTAMQILEKFNYDLLRPYLISALTLDTPGSRMWAATMLGRQRDKGATPYLVPLLNDPEELVRSNTVTALGMIGNASVRLAIEQLETDPSAEVRSAVKEVLSTIY